MAGQMAALKGQAPSEKPRRKIAKKAEESDEDESGTDEDVDSESETDTDTDSDED